MKKLYVVIVAVLAHLMFISSASAQPTNSNQLSDPRVRQALCMAIDMKTIGETLFEDQIIMADSLLPNGPYKSPNLPDLSLWRIGFTSGYSYLFDFARIFVLRFT